MKKLGKILLGRDHSGCPLVIGSLSPLAGAHSSAPGPRPLTSRQFERTPERLERGRYLVHGLMGCPDCHSPERLEDPRRALNLPGMEWRAGHPVEKLPGTSSPRTSLRIRKPARPAGPTTRLRVPSGRALPTMGARFPHDALLHIRGIFRMKTWLPSWSICDPLRPFEIRCL